MNFHGAAFWIMFCCSSPSLFGACALDGVPSFGEGMFSVPMAEYEATAVFNAREGTKRSCLGAFV